MDKLRQLQQFLLPWYGVALLASTVLLPAEVAYHFKLSGDPDQLVGRTGYVLSIVLLYAGFSGPRWTFPFGRHSLAQRALPSWKGWAASLLMLVHLLLVAANHHQPPHLSLESLGVALGVLAALWLLAALTLKSTVR